MSYKKKYGARRETAVRMWRIHESLAKQEYPNCSTLGKEFEVDRRTIFRDVEFMQDHLQLPIVFDYEKNGYYYTKPVSTVPGAKPADESEVFALLVAAKAVKHYEGGVYELLMEMFRKQLIQLEESKQGPMAQLEGSLSIRPFAPEVPDFAKVKTIASAKQGCQVIRFAYQKPEEKQARWRRLEPYHITCTDSRWYVIGWDQDRQDDRMFALSRMTMITVTEERFTMPTDFDAEEYLRRRFLAMSGDGDYEVVLEFDLLATGVLRGRKWHPSQQVEELPDGSSRMRMRISGLDDVARWVLSWGSHVTVLRPSELIEHVVVQAKRVVGLYED